MARSHIIYIIGFMGCGKTTVGKHLASLLNWSFIDLDKMIEERTGKTIPEIFSLNGEDYFRDVETQLLKEFKSGFNSIVSTGGGTPCYSDNMDIMLESGLTIYLKLTPSQLRSRLSESKGDRPLIKDLDHEKLLSFIEKKLADREKQYNRSALIIEGIDLDTKELLLRVKSRLNI